MLTFSRLTHLSVPSMSPHFCVSWRSRQPLTFRAASATTLRYKHQHVCRRTSRNDGVSRKEMRRSSETGQTGRQRPPLSDVTSGLVWSRGWYDHVQISERFWIFKLITLIKTKPQELNKHVLQMPVETIDLLTDSQCFYGIVTVKALNY